MEKEHDIPDFLLFFPALPDEADAFLADASYFLQAFRLFFDDVYRVQTELRHNPFGKYRSDALDESASQVFFHTVCGCRKGFFPTLGNELAAIALVYLPVAGDLQDTSGTYIQQIAYQSDQFAVSFDLYFQDGVSVLGILIRDAFYDAVDFNHGGSVCKNSKLQNYIFFVNFSLLGPFSAIRL